MTVGVTQEQIDQANLLSMVRQIRDLLIEQNEMLRFPTKPQMISPHHGDNVGGP